MQTYTLSILIIVDQSLFVNPLILFPPLYPSINHSHHKQIWCLKMEQDQVGLTPQ